MKMKRPIGHLYKSENFLQANNLESQMLLLENKLSKAIKDLLLTETKLRIAVAFIGDGACNLINQRADDVKIVCNLSMGGTNPNEIKEFIRRFGKKNVKHIDNLHAKLYIGTEYAIVGSANMSSNGLGTQPTALREAGYKFKVDQPSGKRSADWFDELWADACGITTKDLKNAEDKWNRRDRNRNGEVKTGSRDICDYDFDCKNFPLLDWIGDSGGKVVDNHSTKSSSLGGWPNLNDAAANGTDVVCDDDIPHLCGDRWILKFQLRKNTQPVWSQLSGTILINIWKYDEDDDLTSVAVSKFEANSVPFKIDKKFVEEFRSLLFGSGKYKDLTNVNYECCWFSPRIELMRSFWKELQSRLCQQKKLAIFREE